MFLNNFTNILVNKLLGNDLVPKFAKNLLKFPNYTSTREFGNIRLHNNANFLYIVDMTFVAT